jgi:hypothetical protein
MPGMSLPGASADNMRPGMWLPTEAGSPPPGGNGDDGPVDGWWSYTDAGVTGASTNPSGQWSYWGQDGQEGYYGYYPPTNGYTNQITTPAAFGVATAPEGAARIYRLNKPAGDTAIHHKLYKGWSATTWPGGSEAGGYSHNSTPADVSGRYIVWSYLQSSGLNMLAGSFMNMAQFKENYTDENGGFQSDPSWWTGIVMSGGIPYLQMAHWNITPGNYDLIDYRPYLDKWTKFEMRVYQGDRIEMWVDDVLLDTGLNSEWRVGRKFYVGQAGNGGHTVTAARGWTFGSGNYLGPESSAGYNSSGVQYVGPARVIPLS